jgi:hypothetical protein
MKKGRPDARAFCAPEYSTPLHPNENSFYIVPRLLTSGLTLVLGVFPERHEGAVGIEWSGLASTDLHVLTYHSLCASPHKV